MSMPMLMQIELNVRCSNLGIAGPKSKHFVPSLKQQRSRNEVIHHDLAIKPIRVLRYSKSVQTSKGYCIEAIKFSFIYPLSNFKFEISGF